MVSASKNLLLGLLTRKKSYFDVVLQGSNPNLRFLTKEGEFSLAQTLKELPRRQFFFREQDHSFGQFVKEAFRRFLFPPKDARLENCPNLQLMEDSRAPEPLRLRKKLTTKPNKLK